MDWCIVLVKMPLSRFEECWPLSTESLPEFPYNLNIVTLTLTLWPINCGVLTSLLLPHLSSSLTDSLSSLNLLYHSKTDARFMQDGRNIYIYIYIYIYILHSGVFESWFHALRIFKIRPTYMVNFVLVVSKKGLLICACVVKFECVWILVGWLVGWLVEFYGISTFIGYLIPNPFLYK